jgi:hypothetical protein
VGGVIFIFFSFHGLKFTMIETDHIGPKDTLFYYAPLAAEVALAGLLEGSKKKPAGGVNRFVAAEGWGTLFNVHPIVV